MVIYAHFMLYNVTVPKGVYRVSQYTNLIFHLIALSHIYSLQILVNVSLQYVDHVNFM